MEKAVSPWAMKGKAWLDRAKFGTILRIIGQEPRTFLDIGCGNGRYLQMFAERGMPPDRIHGLELSELTVGELRTRGFNAHCRRVEDCEEIPLGSIDLASMFHVIEHVADPRAVIERISRWLSKNGCLVVETPNTSALDARLFRRTYWGGYHIPRHWTLFNEASLRFLFEQAGFDVLHVSYQTGHSFWMYSVHHTIKYNSILPMSWLARWFDPLRGLPFLMAFTGFDLLRRRLGAQTSALLMIARKRG